ncbi:MAG: ferredoxin [Candidatus Natronoplasma sp.]
MKKIKIDQDACIGARVCESVCSEVFEMNPENKSSVVEEYRKGSEDEGEVPDEIECVKKAEEGCPVDAISVS